MKWCWGCGRLTGQQAAGRPKHPPLATPPTPIRPPPSARSNLRIVNVSDGDRPGEKYAQLQYSLLDKRTPALDESGKKIRRVLIENGRFLQVRSAGGFGALRFVAPLGGEFWWEMLRAELS